MHFDEYQMEALNTAIYPDNYKIIYPVLGLVNEAGEVAGKLKKVYRDDGISNKEFIENMKKELGDVLWYVSAIASDLDLSLNEIAEGNVTKLKDRQERGVLKGNGDNR